MLNQKQLFVASRLFVIAGKAGEPFDLSKFSNDREYALATVASLASRLSEPAAQPVIAEMMVLLNEGAVSTTTVIPVPAAATVAPATEAPRADKYVGRLR